MLFFMLLQIACSLEEENASCPSAGDSIVLEDTAFEPSPLVGLWRSTLNEGQSPWVNKCADSEEFSLSTESWANLDITVYQDEDGLWAQFGSSDEQFLFAEDGGGGASMTGVHDTLSGQTTATFSGLLFEFAKGYEFSGSAILWAQLDSGQTCIASVGWISTLYFE